MARETWLVTGATGQLGGHLLYELARTRPAARVIAVSRSPAAPPVGGAAEVVELADTDALREVIRRHGPDYVIHAGAMTAVAQCHGAPGLAERINRVATRVLAEAVADRGARMVFTSTDMAFAGDKAPYRENDPPDATSCYGRSKVAAEQDIAELAGVLTVRIPLLFGPPRNDRATTFTRQVAALRAGEPLRLFTDEYRTPLFLPDAARALVALARSDLDGVMHVAGPERLSRYELIERVARRLKIDKPNLIACSRLSIEAAEPRPEDLSLDGSTFVARYPALAPRPVEACPLEDC